ncbi:hypothetical protein ADM96_04040 [Burkholderia sp. ST111]|nr:hypothetical protein ADM96_04040 [Burkholderia sp. ST111]
MIEIQALKRFALGPGTEIDWALLHPSLHLPRKRFQVNVKVVWVRKELFDSPFMPRQMHIQQIGKSGIAFATFRSDSDPGRVTVLMPDDIDSYLLSVIKATDPFRDPYRELVFEFLPVVSIHLNPRGLSGESVSHETD